MSTDGTTLRDGATLGGLAAAMRRRKRAFVVVALPCTAGFVAAAFLIPPRYRAEALVVAEPMVPSTPNDQSPYVPPQVNAERQLEAIRTILLRRSLLEEIAGAFAMFPGVERISEKELDDLRSRVRIRVEGEKTFAIGFEDRQRRRVADVSARLATLLVETAGAERRERDEATTAFLESQVRELEAELATKEAALGRYREEHVQEIPEQVGTTLKLLDSTQASLQAISTALADEEERRGAIQRELGELRRQGIAEGDPPGPVARRLEELRASLRLLQLRYTAEHPDVRRARKEVEDLEDALRAPAAAPVPADYTPQRQRYVQLQAELAAIEERVARSRAERGALLAQSADYQRRIEAAPGHEMAMTAMTREIESVRARHQALVERLHVASFDAGLGRTSEGAAYRILEAPRVPDRPFAPDRLRIGLMGLAAALVLGAAAAFLADQLDASFGTPEEVEAASGLPVLVSIPAHPPSPGDAEATGVASIDDPEGAAAEQYRILATRLTRDKGPSAPTCLLVTSPLGGEGKTTTAVNVALALSRLVPEGVLLVDADLGRPKVDAMLGLPPGDGLRQLLQRPADDPMVHCRSHQGIYVLEAGGYTEETRFALSSPLAHRVFLRLRQRFAHIVIDAPPLLAVAEGLILEHLADTTLLVVRARRTPRQALERALRCVDASRVAGIALNDVDPGLTRAYGYAYVRERPAPSRKAAAG
jgi:polysaccharide chain length determinant protein (PEP-CTERM system associated)